jgi:Ca2+-binding RTX toxin-like protein
MAKKIEGMPWDDGGWIMGFGEWWWRGTQTVGLIGTDEAEEIYGYGGNDSLHGNGGDDVLDGGTGHDFMNGGMGNDTYYVDDAGDVAVDDADVYDAEGNPANAGYDRVYASVSHTLGFGIEELRLVEGSAATNGTGNSLDNTIHGNSNDNELRSGGGRDWLYGNGDNDTLRGEAGDDFLYGGSHGDSLFGGTENDLLDGGTGGDKMRGEAGNDKYYVDNTLDEVIETANQGYDTVISSISHALWVNVEELRLLDSGGAINGTGNALGNDIYGNDSSNTLDGGGGNDDLVGNGGDDTYWIDSAGDRVFESAGEGADTVYVQGLVNYTLGANVENLVLWTGINGTGNGLANRISGNVLDNVIDGGLGNDTLNGGQGSDTASFASWDALTQGQFESIRIDLVQGTAQRTLPMFNNILIESDTLTGFEHVRGSNLTETIVGDSRDNKLEGRGGNDLLQGNQGNDQLDGGDGRDTASYESNLGSVAVSLSWNGGPGFTWEFFTTPSGQTGILSTDTLVSIENVRGSAFADSIYGNEGDNVIDGRGSADQMFGLTGNDTYFVDNANDAVVEGTGLGTLDVVRASVSYTLAAGTEVEVLETTNQAGTASINLTGNEFGNTINGNNGANVIDGGHGNDTLFGGGNADIFVFDHIVNGSQQDVVLDFQAGIDHIDLSDTLVNNFADLLDYTSLANPGDKYMEQVGNDVLIHTSVSADTSILLQNVQLSSLTSADFLF